MSHTPGPWDYVNLPRHEFAIFGKDMEYVCQADNKANAQLIAAAPELLAALKDILPVFRLWVPMATDLTQWKNALDVIDRAERSKNYDKQDV